MRIIRPRIEQFLSLDPVVTLGFCPCDEIAKAMNSYLERG